MLAIAVAALACVYAAATTSPFERLADKVESSDLKKLKALAADPKVEGLGDVVAVVDKLIDKLHDRGHRWNAEYVPLTSTAMTRTTQLF